MKIPKVVPDPVALHFCSLFFQSQRKVFMWEEEEEIRVVVVAFLSFCSTEFTFTVGCSVFLDLKIHKGLD